MKIGLPLYLILYKYCTSVQAPSGFRRLEKQPRLPSPSLLRASCSAPEGRHQASRSFDSYMDRLLVSNWENINFLILLFLFSLYFWTNALFHIASIFDPLGSFSRTAREYKASSQPQGPPVLAAPPVLRPSNTTARIRIILSCSPKSYKSAATASGLELIS